jgi:hypothetical protein
VQEQQKCGATFGQKLREIGKYIQLTENYQKHFLNVQIWTNT